MRRDPNPGPGGVTESVVVGQQLAVGVRFNVTVNERFEQPEFEPVEQHFGLALGGDTVGVRVIVSERVNFSFAEQLGQFGDSIKEQKMKAGFVIVGAKELEANLKTLGRKVQKRVVRQAVRAAQKPLLARAKANARSISRAGRMGPLMAKNIVIKAPKKQRPGTYALHVQMRAGVDAFVHRTKGGKQYFIPALIEHGHGPTAAQAARPFLRPAADATRGEAKRILSKELRIGILREAIKGRYA